VSKRAWVAGALDRVGVLAPLLAVRARPWWPWQSLLVLTYHRVAAAGSGHDAGVVDATPEQFDRQLGILRQHFSLVGLDELRAFRAGARLPPNPAVVTFDDGYLDNHDQALPILLRHGVRAIFFVATGYITDRRLFWWERISYLTAATRRDRLAIQYPEAAEFPVRDEAGRQAAARALHAVVKQRRGLDLDRFLDGIVEAAGVPWSAAEERRQADALLMTWDHVRALRDAGMDVQSHTRSHRILKTMSPDDLERELAAAKADLERELDRPITALAYPAGSSIADDAAVRAAVARAGYELGFTTSGAVNDLRKPLDFLDIARRSIDMAVSDSFFRAMLAIPALGH